MTDSRDSSRKCQINLELLVEAESKEVFREMMGACWKKPHRTQLEWGTEEIRDNLSIKINKETVDYSPLNKRGKSNLY